MNPLSHASRGSHRSTTLIIVITLVLIAGIAHGQKARNYTDVTGELTSKIIATVPSGKSLHVAVVPFSATAASVEKGTQFGEYITETIIGNLTGNPDKIKVFERTRLDAVLKEQQFILTDLMKPAAALKIGELVPIDALLSGTYTKLKSYVDVNARLIDVATGEITVSFNGRIKITKNLATLFKENATTSANGGDIVISLKSENKPAVTAKTREQTCKEHEDHIRPFIQDLTSDEKVNKAVSEAMKIPYEYTCGAHIILTYALTRYKILNEPYKQFLLKGLDTITYHDVRDERPIMTAHYIVLDDNIDVGEWKSSLDAMKRMDQYTSRIIIENVLGAPKSPGEEAMKARVGQYFDLASAGQLGVPRRMNYDQAFFLMMNGLYKNAPLRRDVYSTYAGKLRLDDRSRATLATLLHKLYKDSDVASKPEVMKWIVDFVNSNEYPKAAEDLYDFVRGWESSDSNLQLLVDGAKDKFSKYAVQTEYWSQKEDRVNFCIAHNIPIPGVIPTMEEADAILKGNNAAEQDRVVKMLLLMGNRTKPLENSLVGLFSKRSLEEREKLSQAQTGAIIILGNLKTSDPKAINYMIEVLPHYGMDTDAAMTSLVQIGKPAVAPVIARLDKTTVNDGGLQYQLITILGKIGKPAAAAQKSIERVLKMTSNGDIKYAAEAALQEIQK